MPPKKISKFFKDLIDNSNPAQLQNFCRSEAAADSVIDADPDLDPEQKKILKGRDCGKIMHKIGKEEGSASATEPKAVPLFIVR